MFHLDHLPNSRPDEKAVICLRRHWIALVTLLALTALACALPWLLWWLLGQTAPGLLSQNTSEEVGRIFTLVFYLAVATFFFQEFVDYWLDMWIVTTERVIDIEQLGLFNRTTSELHLAAIQDVSAEIKGVTATFLDYGDVYVQTAGSVTHFHFQAIPHPERVRETILRLVDEDKKRHAAEMP